ncbi:MAG: hypothetical protein ACHREM_26105 [Polyangiales bacterium]
MLMAPAWPYDPRLRELLVAFRKLAAKADRSYAIVGAVAMAAHGYTRPTQDLDVFLARRDVLVWLRAARVAGFSISLVYEGRHYIAWLRRHDDFDVHLHLLFPSQKSFKDGVPKAEARRVGGVAAKVLPLDLLAAAMLRSRSEKGQADFDAMSARGLIDRHAVDALLRKIRQREAKQRRAFERRSPEPVGWFDPIERAKEKDAQRAEQERRCEEGEESRAQVQREVSFFSAIAHCSLDLSKLRR